MSKIIRPSEEQLSDAVKSEPKELIKYQVMYLTGRAETVECDGVASNDYGVCFMRDNITELAVPYTSLESFRRHHG